MPPKRSTSATPVAQKAGRKRKVSDTATLDASTTSSSAPTPRRKKVEKVHMTYEDFWSKTCGTRVLACGEGDQLGHPGRTTSKKPRKVDFFEENDLKVRQIVAGGVHSVALTEDGTVYACGINEKGTVPADGVEMEGSTDDFTQITFSAEIQALGQPVMLSAGASFTAMLTASGSVVGWGNLRDASGLVDSHQQLVDMQKSPIVLLHHNQKKDLAIVKITAGENHLVMLNCDGRVFTFGDSSVGQLGRSTRAASVRSKFLAGDAENLLVRIVDKTVKNRFQNIITNVFAGGYWTVMITDDNRVFVCGLNNFHQLGVPVEEAEQLPEEESTGEEGTESTMPQDVTEYRVLLPRKSEVYGEHKWTNIDGLHHIIARSENGDVFAIGKNTDNALGLGTWTGKDDEEHWRYDTLQKLEFDEKVSGSTAKLGSSLAWTEEGTAYAWGYDTSGQLGLGLKDDDEKMVSTPEEISSAHLDGFKIIQASVADNHSLFLAIEK